MTVERFELEALQRRVEALEARVATLEADEERKDLRHPVIVTYTNGTPLTSTADSAIL